MVGYEVGVVCEDRMQGMLQMEKWIADGKELLQLVRLYCFMVDTLTNIEFGKWGLS